MVCATRIILLFVLVEMTLAAVFNGSFLDHLDMEDTALRATNTRRKQKNRSTSSSSKSKRDKEKSKRSEKSKVSLDMTTSTSSSSEEDNKNKKKKGNKAYAPKSTVERHGWRKYHRKCTPCPADMPKKWRDPSIKWICGGYQRARRSFKSLCMMHYRNCQDGTMFTKLADHRCPNASDLFDHGDHFMYDYTVSLSDESASVASSSKSKYSSISKSHSSSSTSSDSGSWDTDAMGRRPLRKNKKHRIFP